MKNRGYKCIVHISTKLIAVPYHAHYSWMTLKRLKRYNNSGDLLFMHMGTRKPQTMKICHRKLMKFDIFIQRKDVLEVTRGKETIFLAFRYSRNAETRSFWFWFPFVPLVSFQYYFKQKENMTFNMEWRKCNANNVISFIPNRVFHFSFICSYNVSSIKGFFTIKIC